MEINEIKKALYREKPEAHLLHSFPNMLCYKTYLNNGYAVAFEVPKSDIGETDFKREMPSQLLIRWMVNQ